MTPLYTYNGKLLVRSGALATSASCCCDNYYCYKSTEQISCPCPGVILGGYYYILATDAENTINDFYDPNLVFNRVDENTFQDSGDPPTITMVKQPGGPYPANHNCGVRGWECPCPPVVGTWRIDGWYLDCEAPSGVLSLETYNCGSPEFSCLRELVLHNFPDGVGSNGPIAWQEMGIGIGQWTATVIFNLPCGNGYVIDSNGNPINANQDFVAGIIEWNLDVCANAPYGNFPYPNVLAGEELGGYAEVCSDSSFEFPNQGEEICCEGLINWCSMCGYASNTAVFGNSGPSYTPCTSPLKYGKFIGIGDFDNYNNYDHSDDNGIIGPGAVVSSARYFPIFFGLLQGSIQIGFYIDHLAVEGGTITGGGAACQDIGEPRGCNTFEFLGGEISDVTLGSASGGTMDSVTIATNATLTTPSVTFHNSTNNGIIDGLTSTAIFSGNSINNRNVEGNVEFRDTAQNSTEGIVNGNATFKNGTKNYGTINGDATFEPGSCNSGTVNGTTTGSPPAC